MAATTSPGNYPQHSSTSRTTPLLLPKTFLNNLPTLPFPFPPFPLIKPDGLVPVKLNLGGGPKGAESLSGTSPVEYLLAGTGVGPDSDEYVVRDGVISSWRS